MWALLGYRYPWASPRALRFECTIPDIVDAWEMLPRLEQRAAYPFARLSADLRNMMGGKGGGKPVDPSKLFTAEDFLGAYVAPIELGMSEPERITREAARDFIAHTGELSQWVLAIAPIQTLKAIADS